MVTSYSDDYTGKRDKDAVEARPAEIPATPVQGDPEDPKQVAAKVVSAPEKATPKKSTTAQTKG